MLIASKDKSLLISRLKSQLNNEFEMNDLGAVKKTLGMEIHRYQKANNLYFSQSNCKSVNNPLAAYFKLSSKTCPIFEVKIEKMSHVPYSSAIQSLMYAMVCTRPDLAYIVSVVSRYMHSLGKDHWEAIKLSLIHI